MHVGFVGLVAVGVLEGIECNVQPPSPLGMCLTLGLLSTTQPTQARRPMLHVFLLLLARDAGARLDGQPWRIAVGPPKHGGVF